MFPILYVLAGVILFYVLVCCYCICFSSILCYFLISFVLVFVFVLLSMLKGLSPQTKRKGSLAEAPTFAASPPPPTGRRQETEAVLLPVNSNSQGQVREGVTKKVASQAALSLLCVRPLSVIPRSCLSFLWWLGCLSHRKGRRLRKLFHHLHSILEYSEGLSEGGISSLGAFFVFYMFICFIFVLWDVLLVS